LVSIGTVLCPQNDTEYEKRFNLPSPPILADGWEEALTEAWSNEGEGKKNLSLEI
jgi:hypothetical protein